MSKPVAVEVYGLKETQRALKEIPEAIEDLKTVHRKVGDLVLTGALRRMPSDSGKLKSSYKVGNIRSGAKLSSSLVYAGVSEFGGSIPRKGSGGPLAASHRESYSQRAVRLGVSVTHHKPPAKSVGLKSYYVYPAAESLRARIIRIYQEELDTLFRKYGLEG